MNSNFDILFLRRLKFDYHCPAVCEVDFSSSASPIIVLEDLHKLPAPSGLILGGEGGFRLSWDNYPGALCYSVYKAVNPDDPFGDYVLVAECVDDTFLDLSEPGVYRVTVITPDGESDPSDPITVPGGKLSGPLAWFSFENPTNDALTYDSVLSIPATLDLVSSLFAGSATLPDIAGKIGNGFSPVTMYYGGSGSPFPQDYYTRNFTATLGAVDLTSGVSLAFWLRIGGSDAYGETVLDLKIKNGASAELATIRFAVQDIGGHVKIQIVGQTAIYEPSFLFGVHHIILRYDGTTGKLKLRFDNGADFEIPDAYVIPGIAASCELSISGDSPSIPANFPAQVYIWYDELSVWPFNIDETLMAQIYKGGAGSQWPL